MRKGGFSARCNVVPTPLPANSGELFLGLFLNKTAIVVPEGRERSGEALQMYLLIVQLDEQIRSRHSTC
jgi:hypothetical protein